MLFPCGGHPGRIRVDEDRTSGQLLIASTKVPLYRTGCATASRTTSLRLLEESLNTFLSMGDNYSTTYAHAWNERSSSKLPTKEPGNILVHPSPMCYVDEVSSNVVVDGKSSTGGGTLRPLEPFNSAHVAELVKHERIRKRAERGVEGALDRRELAPGYLELHRDVFREEQRNLYTRGGRTVGLYSNLDHLFSAARFHQHPWTQSSGFFGDDQGSCRRRMFAAESWYRHGPKSETRFVGRPGCQISTTLCQDRLQQVCRTALLQQYSRAARERSWRVLHRTFGFVPKRRKQHKRSVLAQWKQLYCTPIANRHTASLYTRRKPYRLSICPVSGQVRRIRGRPNSVSFGAAKSLVRSSRKRNPLVSPSVIHFLNKHRSFRSGIKKKSPALATAITKTLEKTTAFEQKRQIDFPTITKGCERQLQGASVTEIGAPVDSNRFVGYRPAVWEEDALNEDLKKLKDPHTASLTLQQREQKAWWIFKRTRRLLQVARRHMNAEYVETLRFLYNQTARKTAKGVINIQTILEAMGRPAERMNVILVGGSVGKTTVATKIAAALSSAGYRVGLFVAPHLATFRERISVDGSLITKSECSGLVAALRAVMRRLKSPMPSLFEWMTLIAVAHFHNHDCQYIVLEMGCPTREDKTIPTADPTTAVTSRSLRCLVLTSFSLSLPQRNFDKLLRHVLRYYPLMGFASFGVVCGPSATDVFRFLNAHIPRFGKRYPLPSKATFLEHIPRETFLEEDTRIAEATLTQLNIPLFHSSKESMKQSCPLLRFQCLDHRTRQLAARHIHYYLQFAYNTTRAMHLQWRLLALAYPELFVHIFKSTRGNQGVRVLQAQAPEFDLYLKERCSKTAAEHDCLDQLSVTSSSYDDFSNESQCRARVSKKSALRRKQNAAMWRQERYKAFKAVQDVAKHFTAVLNAKGEHTKSKFSGRLWNVPENRRYLIEGAQLLLSHGTQPVEKWPRDYSSQLPFDNCIKTFRRLSNTTTDRVVFHLEMRQQQMMKIVHGLSEAREQRVLASSFHRFAAYNHEALYWSFRNVVTLRERNSISIRRPDIIHNVGPHDAPITAYSHTMRGLQHVKGIGLPSQTGRMIGVMKTKLRQAHALASHLRAMHYLFPTPRAVVIDCPQDEIAFQRCFSDVRQRFAGHRVRICVALSCRESLTVLNCLIPILNATGQDPTSLPCPILGIHILQAEHWNAKSVADALTEIRKNTRVDAEYARHSGLASRTVLLLSISQMNLLLCYRIRRIILRTVVEQSRAQLVVAAPISPIPLELLAFLEVLRTPRRHQKDLEPRGSSQAMLLRSRLLSLLKTYRAKSSDVSLLRLDDSALLKQFTIWLSDSERYGAAAKVILNYLNVAARDADEHQAIRLPRPCHGNVRVLRRMRHICRFFNYPYTGQLSAACVLKSWRERFEFSLPQYLSFVPKKPSRVLEFGMTWNSLMSLWQRHRVTSLFGKSGENKDARLANNNDTDMLWRRSASSRRPSRSAMNEQHKALLKNTVYSDIRQWVETDEWTNDNDTSIYNEMHSRRKRILRNRQAAYRTDLWDIYNLWKNPLAVTSSLDHGTHKLFTSTSKEGMETNNELDSPQEYHRDTHHPSALERSIVRALDCCFALQSKRFSTPSMLRPLSINGAKKRSRSHGVKENRLTRNLCTATDSKNMSWITSSACFLPHDDTRIGVDNAEQLFWAQLIHDEETQSFTVHIQELQQSKAAEANNSSNNSAQSTATPLSVVLPLDTYCDNIAARLWYTVYKQVRRNAICWRTAVYPAYRTKKILRTVAKKLVNHSLRTALLRPLMLRRCRYLQNKRIKWSWEQVKHVVRQQLYQAWARYKYSGYSVKKNNDCSAVSWRPVMLEEPKKPKFCNASRHRKSVSVTDAGDDGFEGDCHEREAFSSLPINFGALNHLLKLNPGEKNDLVDVFQPGDLQLQLSVAFQKASVEGSVLLVCGSPVMGLEVLETFGVGSITGRRDPRPVVTYKRLQNGAVTFEMLNSKGKQSLAGFQQKDAFAKGYATLSPAALARDAANSYLSRAYCLRKENEISRKTEIARYTKEKEYLL